MRGLALGWTLDQELAFLASMRRLAGVKARERGRLEKIGLPSALVICASVVMALVLIVVRII